MKNADVQRITDAHRALTTMWETLLDDFRRGASDVVYWCENFNGKPIGKKGRLARMDPATGTIEIKVHPIGMIRTWTVNEFFRMMIGRESYLDLIRAKPEDGDQ